MTRIFTRRLTALMRCTLLTTTCMLATPSLAQSNEQIPPDQTGLQDIIVTAQRREENLQVVPIAVTALTTAALTSNRIQNLQDLNAVAPSLTVVSPGGGGQTVLLTMRGIASFGALPGLNSGVSTYVDGVYQGSSQGAVFDLADIERIEVLRGPQGTLFGRNSNGGAVSITTRRPSGEFHVHQELTYGNYDQFRSKTRVDLPSWGPLSVSGTYVHNQRRGDILNLGAGTQWDFTGGTGGIIGLRTSPKWLGSQNSESFAGTAVLKPAEGLEIVYKFDSTHNNYTDMGQGLAMLGTGGAGGLAQAAYFAQNPALRTPITTERPEAVNNAFTTPGTLKVHGHDLTASYQINDIFAVKNILAYRSTHIRSTSQLDALGGISLATALGPFFPGTAAALGLPGITEIPALIGTINVADQHQWSNETQLNITTDWFDVTAGFFYFHETSDSGPAPFGVSGAPGGGAQGSITAASPYVLVPQGQFRSRIVSDSYALYGQSNFHLTDRLDLVLGLRETVDHKYGQDRLSRATPAALANFDTRNDKPTWSAGLNFRPTDQILLYGKASTGYISGGQLGGIVFKPETVISYEAGLKGDFFDRRVRANIALYHAKYDALQFIASVPIGGVPTTVVLNAGTARAQGIEVETTFLPTRGLTLEANFSYLDFKYLTIDPLLLAVNGITADQFYPATRPAWTGHGAVQYETTEMAWGGRISARVDALYRGKFFSSFSATSPAMLDAISQPAQVILNARLALTEVPIGPVKAQLAFWGRNLTDNGAVGAQAFYGYVLGNSYERARTYGVDLTVDF
jgi:iron complex outermembrane receptor protein